MVVFDIARGAGAQLIAAGSQIRESGGHLRTAGSHLTVLSTPRRRIDWSEGFYDAVALKELRRYKPGEIIRYEPMHAYLMPGLRLKARAFRLLYRSTGAVGEPTAVSGKLLLPEGRRSRGTLPLIAYAVGTHGIGDGAAPSRMLASGRDWEATTIAHVIARGFAVAVTDYQGLGTPGDHAFMVGRALGMNVLDVLRACSQVVPDELEVDGSSGVIGYSEGGAAAAWAAQLQPTYAPELDIVGVAAGAAAADMEEAGHTLDGTFASFFLAYGAIGYAAAYPELELEPYLTEAGERYIPMLRDSNVIQAALHGPRFAHVSDLTQPNVLELPDWQARLHENHLGSIAPQVPVLLHHARHDQIVAPQHSRQLLEDWRELGADVELRFMRAGVDHLTGGLVGAPVALSWIARRLDQSASGATMNVVKLNPASADAAPRKAQVSSGRSAPAVA